MPIADARFNGSIPQLYERYLVPLIFQPYADDVAARVAQLAPNRVLELAAGTGVVTRQLARVLPPSAEIIATDLNQAMLDQAAAIGTARPVSWQQADASKLPFPAASFDVVVCQFGAMFFPARAHAYAEARRVLKRGGHFLFSVWDRIEENAFADVVTDTLAQLFPEDPPRFLARTPHGYHDPDVILRDVADGGFAAPDLVTLAARSRAESAGVVAIAYCQGTPVRNEIEARGEDALEEVTAQVKEALARRFGIGSVEGKIQAHVIAVQA